MLKPLTLKVTHTFKYVELNEEGLNEIYPMVLQGTPALTREQFIRYFSTHRSEPIRIRLNGTTFGVFAGNFLVLQYSVTNTLDGILSYDTKEEMLRFFNETE